MIRIAKKRDYEAGECGAAKCYTHGRSRGLGGCSILDVVGHDAAGAVEQHAAGDELRVVAGERSSEEAADGVAHLMKATPPNSRSTEVFRSSSNTDHHVLFELFLSCLRALGKVALKHVSPTPHRLLVYVVRLHV